MGALGRSGRDIGAGRRAAIDTRPGAATPPPRRPVAPAPVRPRAPAAPPRATAGRRGARRRVVAHAALQVQLALEVGVVRVAERDPARVEELG